MGENEGRAQLGEMYPNGLLPAAGPIIRALDTDRWLKAEESTAELIACIQPNPLSEERRNAVADYVQRLIMKCFPCQVCTFGSVPLKTYLPDGDIDLTAFSHDQNLKDTWASQVRDMLEDEEKNENAEFHVKEVQYIQAEVKIIKCLVENIVVDISFNQVGGLCTLCFLDEVDHLISQDHLFKRSIILIKAWCYYESRILGAHHGLISTYALETLVLYIFHVYNKSFHGPLEVLYRFLEFFSNFDWDNYCVSLWGPVPISSLPNITAEAPRKDDGELLLNKFFLRDCSRVYAVFPGGQENNGQPFVLKHFNVIDPLRVNNNLGRSVSKGNFYRIRSAFAFGTKRLTRLLDCPKDDLINEVNQFFLNTWKRHGSGHRPDAPVVDSWETRLLSARDDHHEYGNYTNITSRNIINEHDQVLSNDEDEKYVKADQSVYNTRGRFFARTHSSPELTDAYGDVSSQSRRHRQSQTANVGATSVRIANSDRKDVGSESLVSQVRQTSVEDNSHVTHLPSHIGHDNASSDSNIYSNAYHQNFGLDPSSEDAPSSFSGAQLTHNGEQDIVNMMASASLNGLNGPVHIPLNLNSTHLPFHIPPSFLTAMGYAQWNIQGFAPTNNPLIDPSISSVQFPHSLVSPQLAHYLPSVGVNSQAEDPYDQINENLGSIEMNSTEADSDLWHDQDSCSSPSYDLENGHFKMTQSNDKPPQLVSGLKYVPPHRQTEFSSFNRFQQSSRGKRGSVGPNSDGFSLQDASSCEVFPEERSTSSRISSATRSNSLRSRTSSESSWDGSYVKISKSTKEKRGKKTAPSELVTGHGKGKNTPERIVNQADDEQQRVSRENTATDMVEMEHGSNLVSSLQDSRQHMPGYDVAQTRESDSMAPFAPMFVNSGSRQMINDNSKLVAFYPTGPPIPFFTMLPVYNMPSESGTSDASSSHFGGNETLENCESGQSLFPEEYDQSKDYKTSSSLQGATTTEASEEKKSDILNSDFDSHWQNLQLGRLCQNPRFPAPSLYPPPVMVPPVYLQGRFPYENPVRPLPVNSNLFSQLMTSYGHPLVPVPPLQSVPARPPNMYPQYMDDIPRYRSGTGTYLPNPKVAARERHSSGARRGSYTHDRNDTSGDREGNWNANSKSRASSRSYSRSQSDKSNLRVDHMSPSGNRSERSWNAHRHDSTSSDSSQNGPMHSTSGKNGLQNMRYSVYPSASAGPNGISNGPSVPPAVMMYPFDHNATTYGSHEEQFEFVSLGHVNFSGLNKQSRLNEGTRSRTSEEDRTHGSSGHLSSPEQPSSPRHRRRG